MPKAEKQPRPQLPPTGFVRIKTILQFIPVSASTWWEGCRTGRYPKPIKLGHRTTVWRAEDIHALIQELGQGREVEA
ncbi:MAG: AlpA family phage regulatory protein [Clostridia bacterium]|nr:AlpA family phage regulatory protein [Clostridia bacterium]